MLKGFAVAGALLIAIGFGGFGVLGATGHSAPIHSLLQNGMSLNFDKTVLAQSGSTGTNNFDKQQQVSDAGVSTMELDVNVASINVTTSNAKVITAHAYGNIGTIPPKDMTFTVSKNGSFVQIVLKRPSHDLTIVSHQGLTLDVTVPKSVLQTLQIQANVGKINVNDVSAKVITIKSNTGEIGVSNVPGTVSITSDTGAVHVASVQGNVNIQTSTGAIDVSGVQGAVDIRNNVGAVTVRVPSITHDIRVTDNVGSISVGTSEPAANVHFHLHTDMGHVQANVANARYTNQQNTDVEGTVGTGQIQVNLGSNTGGITFESP